MIKIINHIHIITYILHIITYMTYIDVCRTKNYHDYRANIKVLTLYTFQH